MSKRQHSLRRKCFGRLNLLEEFDSCSASVDQATYHTPVDNTVLAPATAHITIEDTDSGSKQPKRRHGSVTPNVLPSPLQSKFSGLRHSTSGSSIDSGVGLSRASCLSSLPYGSKQPSRENSSTVDTASPLLASQKSVNERLSIDDSCGSPCPYSNSVITGEPTNLEILNEGSIIDGEVNDLSQHAQRLSIARGVVEDLQTAVQRLLDDLQQQPPAGQVHRQRHLNVDVRSSVESDGPFFPKRRHSSADPYMPLTQRLSRQVEQKRSAQPFFHQSTEDSSNTTRRCKPSGCIVCERKHREPTMSAESVFIKTARFPEQQKRRRYSEVLKVCKPSDIPYTEVRLMTFEEYRQRDTPNHQRLPRRHAWTLPQVHLLEECDSCSASVDQASCYTPVDNTVPAPATAHITIEDADSGSKQPKRRHGSVTPNVLPSPLQSKFSGLHHSTSGSSIDAGVGLSRASSLSSLPHGSKRPSRESSSTVDTASPLLASQKSVNERLSINDSCGSPCPYSNRVITGEPTNLEILNEGSIIDDEVDDLSQRALRLDISRGVVEDLQTAVQRLLDDLQQQPPTGQAHRQKHLDVTDTPSGITNNKDSHDPSPLCDSDSYIDSHKNRIPQSITHEVPFLHFHVLECDHSGIEYTTSDHDITLRIPEGALSVGESIKFEIGVVMYGPFIFPDNTRPISPIVWLCIQEDIKLKKPFQLVLPHFLIGLKKERLSHHQVTFAKANHSAYNTEKQYIFNRCAQEPLFVSTESRSYAVLTSTHCCFYCLIANNTPELARKAGYCLARIEATLSPQRSEVYFALEEQFCHEKEYRICRYDIFKFNTKELCIMIVPCDLDQCVIALEPSITKIRACDIDFWKLGYDYDIIKLQHEKKMYPPRVKMTVMMRSPDHQVFKLPIEIEGCSSLSDNQLDTELAFPLLRPEIPYLSHSSSSSSSSSVTSGTVIGMGMLKFDTKETKRKECVQEITSPGKRLENYWMSLRVESYAIDKIKKDGDDIHDCLRAMISEWLKQVNLPPTWKELVDAVEDVDSSQAEKMKQYLAC